MLGKRHRDRPGKERGERVSPEGDLALLRKVPVFAGLSDEQIRKMCSIMRREEFDPGDVVIREGDMGDEMYILEEGTVDVSKVVMLRVGRRDFGQREKSIARLSGENHALFGEMVMLEREARSATVTAVTRCRLLVIEREDFERACEEDPLMGYRMAANIARRVSSMLRSSNEDVLKLTTALSLALKR